MSWIERTTIVQEEGKEQYEITIGFFQTEEERMKEKNMCVLNQLQLYSSLCDQYCGKFNPNVLLAIIRSFKEKKKYPMKYRYKSVKSMLKDKDLL